jgi:xanthine dehydrogenase YagT iron-sulfur-binding subunit
MSQGPCEEIELVDDSRVLPRHSGVDSTRGQMSFSRRTFVRSAGILGAAAAAGAPKLVAAQRKTEVEASAPEMISVQLRVNGKSQTLNLDTRTTLLDALRNQLALTGSKKGRPWSVWCLHGVSGRSAGKQLLDARCECC